MEAGRKRKDLLPRNTMDISGKNATVQMLKSSSEMVIPPHSRGGRAALFSSRPSFSRFIIFDHIVFFAFLTSSVL